MDATLLPAEALLAETLAAYGEESCLDLDRLELCSLSRRRKSSFPIMPELTLSRNGFRCDTQAVTIPRDWMSSVDRLMGQERYGSDTLVV